MMMRPSAMATAASTAAGGPEQLSASNLERNLHEAAHSAGLHGGASLAGANMLRAPTEDTTKSRW